MRNLSFFVWKFKAENFRSLLKKSLQFVFPAHSSSPRLELLHKVVYDLKQITGTSEPVLWDTTQPYLATGKRLHNDTRTERRDIALQLANCARPPGSLLLWSPESKHSFNHHPFSLQMNRLRKGSVSLHQCFHVLSLPSPSGQACPGQSCWHRQCMLQRFCNPSVHRM